MIKKTIEKCRGNISAATCMLDTNRNRIYKALRQEREQSSEADEP